jgi:hypothetical protein
MDWWMAMGNLCKEKPYITSAATTRKHSLGLLPEPQFSISYCNVALQYNKLSQVACVGLKWKTGRLIVWKIF